jgi:hypothetical protein
MTISAKHKFTSLKGDGTDSTLLRPSNWNDEHAITLASGNVIGRMTAGNGAAEEIPLTSVAASILAAANVAAILSILGVSPATTGDVKLTLKTVADSGWLLFDDGTFGNAGSGSSNSNSANNLALFTLIFNNISDTWAPILTSSGAATTRAAQTNAATAWAAACRMSLPKTLGRALAVAGSGSGLTARPLGSNTGAESSVIAQAHLPNITLTTTPSALVKGSTVNTILDGTSSVHTNVMIDTGTTTTFTTPLGGSGVALPIMEPTAFLNAMVKI